MAERSQSERRKALKRDGGRCQKCGGGKEVAGHHIIQLAKGGADTAENMIALCPVCHAEWHMLETFSPVPFAAWLQLPPLGGLVRLFDTESLWTERTSARTMRGTILTSQARLREMDAD